MTARALSLFARLRSDRSGVAAVEFALTAPIILTLFLSGAELTNYAIAKLRISQIALHVADNSSRIGIGSPLSIKTISESQINDLLLGANLQAGSLDLLHRGRVVLSSLEAMASPNDTKFTVHWQRCYGQKVFSSAYGAQGATNLTHFGPVNKQIASVTPGTAVMYVEVVYDYKPLISDRLIPTRTLSDIAAMVVRENRDLTGNGGTGVYNSEGVVASTC